jgi:hypothetical protein
VCNLQKGIHRHNSSFPVVEASPHTSIVPERSGSGTQLKSARITNQISGKVALLTMERQIGVLPEPEGGDGRESKEGDGGARWRKATAELVGGNRQR